FSCSSAEINPLLGTEDETISLAHVDYPGLVSLGQVRNGLEMVSVKTDQLFAELTFSQGPSRTSSAFNPAEGGLKLRADGENDADVHNDDDHQFDNADVPFKVTDLNDGVYQVQWEEANDGDYDHNGIANVNDLTPLGVYFGDQLNYSESAWDTTEKTYGGNGQTLFIHRSNATLAIRNINLSSFPSDSPSDSYAPVLRYCDEITTSAPDPPTEPNDFDFV